MGIEFELKYRATPALLEAVRTDVSGREKQFSMHTTYYDTPSGALSARHYTLRRRMENDTSVCTLKYPAGKLDRGEIELECDSIEAALPELCKLSSLADLPALLKEGIVPVCGAKFERTAITLSPQGCTVEIALDQGILYGGGREEALCELEVELKSGSREAASAYAAQLATAYALVPEDSSKFRRALALAEGE